MAVLIARDTENPKSWPRNPTIMTPLTNYFEPPNRDLDLDIFKA